MAEAGVTISLAANSMHLLREFGLAWTVPRMPLSNMHAHNLPEPFLAISSQEVLRENAKLIDSLLPPLAQGPRRRLTLAFDKTYLLKSLDVIALRRGKGFVGGAFKLCSMATKQDQEHKEDEYSGFLPLRDHHGPAPADPASQEASVYDASRLQFAAEMLEMLLWDPMVQPLQPSQRSHGVSVHRPGNVGDRWPRHGARWFSSAHWSWTTMGRTYL